MTVDEVRKSGRKALLGSKRPMTRLGRAIEKGETQGSMKVAVDAETEEILGAAVLGVGGDEVIHAVLDIMSAKKSYTAIARTMHIHPPSVSWFRRCHHQLTMRVALQHTVVQYNPSTVGTSGQKPVASYVVSFETVSLRWNELVQSAQVTPHSFIHVGSRTSCHVAVL